jgi:ParB-like chromosome segregation protein Spo0J
MPDQKQRSVDTLQELELSELHPSPYNPREITEEALSALAYSLQQDPSMLRARPVICDTDGMIVCGEMRWRAANRLGWQTVWAYPKQFESEAQKREWMLRDNNEFGNWVPDELQALVRAHQQEGSDLRLLGFAQQELKDLLSVPDTALPDAPVQEVPVIFGVVIDCDTEEQQAALLEELNGRGLSCRALMA